MSRAFAAYLLDALGARPGERAAIVADADRAATARAVERRARERDVDVRLVTSDRDYRREADMPAEAIAAIDAADLALLLVGVRRIQFGGHSEFRKRASARGARVGFVTHDLPEIDATALAGVAAHTRRVAASLTAASRAVVTSPRGTRLELDVSGRPGLALTNELGEPGAWGALPEFFEAAVAPVEGTATGRLVVDGTSLVTGIASEPIELSVRDGTVTELRGGQADELRAYLDDAGENARNLAELGIGTNTLAPPALTGTFVDKRIGGTVHFGLGDNRGLGGRTRAAVHTDVQVMDATVALDGEVL